MSLCKGCLRNNEQARCILVDTVHKTHLWVIGIEFGIILQMPCHGIDECSVCISTARMYNQACRLVHDHEVIILIDNIERDILGDNGIVVGRGVECDHNLVAWLYLVVALYNLSVDGD